MIVLDGTSGITSPNETITGSLNTPNTFGFKNRIINGGMVIDQRNAHASFTVGTGATSFVADRFFCYSFGGQTFGANSPGLPAGSGFNYGLTLLPQTGATSVQLAQKIESYNAMDLAAQTVTLSFWLYTSSLSGTASYVQPYTPTAQDNYAGTNYGASQALSYTNGAWVKNTFTFSSSNGSMNFANGAAILFNFVSAVGATIWVTGVQLEKGSVATSFDQRAYSQELAMCQRYYQKSYEQATALGTVTTTGEIRFQTAGTGGESFPTIMFPVVMRAIPTLTFYSANNGASGVFYNYSTGTNPAMATVNTNGSRGFSGGVGATAANICGYHFTASAEL